MISVIFFLPISQVNAVTPFIGLVLRRHLEDDMDDLNIENAL